MTYIFVKITRHFKFTTILIFSIILLSFLYVIPREAAAQKTLESTTGEKTSTNTEAEKILRSYFENIFTKNYEEAILSMHASARSDETIAKIERWRETFMSPENLKILNFQNNSDDTLTATVTFSYTSSSGVKDILREKILISSQGKNYYIKSHPSLDKRPAARQAAGAGFAPITMTPNVPGGSMPDMNGILNMLSGGASAGGSTQVDPGELLGLMTELVNDPDVLALSSNPKIMSIAQDPSIMTTLLSGNLSAIEANPKIKELLSDRSIRKIIEKVAAKKSGGERQENASPAHPSSIDSVDINKLFD